MNVEIMYLIIPDNLATCSIKPEHKKFSAWAIVNKSKSSNRSSQKFHFVKLFQEIQVAYNYLHQNVIQLKVFCLK